MPVGIWNSGQILINGIARSRRLTFKLPYINQVGYVNQSTPYTWCNMPVFNLMLWKTPMVNFYFYLLFLKPTKFRFHKFYNQFSELAASHWKKSMFYRWSHILQLSNVSTAIWLNKLVLWGIKMIRKLVRIALVNTVWGCR